jgi:hypothetical protein
MWAFMDEVLRQTWSGFADRVIAFGPNLLAMLVTIVAGAVLAGAAHVMLRWLLPRVGIDRFAEHTGVAGLLEKGGIAQRPSRMLAAVVAWGVFGVFALLAIAALDIQIAMELIGQTFAYLPQMLIGLAILLLGGLLAAFVRRSVLIAAVNAGLPSARLLASGIQGALWVLFAAMALEHLGVGPHVILIAFAILFGGVVLALALAFGLAGRDLAHELLARISRESKAAPNDVSRHL